jgi:tetratricopeptide (TPR) repeat protein
LVLSSAIAGSLVALVATGYGVRGWYREVQVRESRRLGLELYAAGRFAEALQPLSLATRDASDIEVLLALADARRSVPSPRLRHLQIANGMFAKAESLDPKNRRAIEGQLGCVVGLGYLDQIPEVASRLLAIDPESVRAREAVLEVRAAQGRWPEVIRIAEELQKIEPREIRWRAIEMQALASSGADPEGRLALIDRWIGELTDSANTEEGMSASVGLQFLRADVLRASGRINEAREIYATVAQNGVTDARLLTPLLEGLAGTGQESLINSALEASRARLQDSLAIFEIEGERLLAAGRLRELEERLAALGHEENIALQRFRATVAYLSGDRDKARQILARQILATTVQPDGSSKIAQQATDGSQMASEGVDALRIALSQDPALSTRRARIEELRTTIPSAPQDPVAAIVLADLLIEAGEYDDAARVLTVAFDRGGRRHQPVGLRLVRLLAALERVPDALAVARDLGVRYQADSAVAAAILEAWSGALQAGFTPSRVFGALASDSPDALYEYWSAMGRPRELGPLVAEVYARRGIIDRSDAIIAELLERAETAEQVLALVSASSRSGNERVMELLTRAASLPSQPRTALRIATQLESLGRRDDAATLLRRATEGASGDERLRLERALRLLQTPPAELVQQLGRELANEPSAECASFVLARPEVWKNSDDVRIENSAIVTKALDVLRLALGEESLRVVIAEATFHLLFYPNDQARIAKSVAALAQLERVTPDSVALLATLARLLEAAVPPDPVRAAEYLTRAVQLQPGNSDLYPDLVRVLQRTGEFDAAARAIDVYARLMGEDLARGRTAAELLESQGDFTSAAELRAQVSQRTKDSLDQLALVRAKVRAGDVTGAEATLREMAVGPDSQLAQRELSRLLASTGRVAEARSLLDEVARRAKDLGGTDIARVDALRAEIEFGFGSLRDAEDSIRRAIELQPLPASRLLLARILQRSAKLEDARAVVLDLIRTNPDIEGLLPTAATVLAGDRSEDGRAAFRRALDLTQHRYPDFASAIAVLDAATDVDGMLRPDAEALRAARQLTVLHSGSPLSWRLAAQFHSVAGQAEEAARLAMLGVSRLPTDESLAELAVTLDIAAGRVDDAAAVASAWRRMTGANELSSRSAQALVELVRRNADRAIEALEPMRSTIVSSPNADDALSLYVSAHVLAGRSATLKSLLEGLDAERRRLAVTVWMDTARGLNVEKAVESIEALAAYVGPSRAHGCVALLTEQCAAGSTSACEVAAAMLSQLDPAADAGIPLPLLEADLAAARSRDAASRVAALDIYQSILKRGFGDDSASLDVIAARLGQPTIREQLRSNALLLAAMNNVADFLRRDAAQATLAVAFARAVVEAVPQSGDAADTLFQCILASGDARSARELAGKNPDRLLGTVEFAESSIALRDISQAREALRSVDAITSRMGVVRAAIARRIEDVRSAIENFDNRAGGSS